MKSNPTGYEHPERQQDRGPKKQRPLEALAKVTGDGQDCNAAQAIRKFMNMRDNILHRELPTANIEAVGKLKPCQNNRTNNQKAAANEQPVTRPGSTANFHPAPYPAGGRDRLIDVSCPGPVHCYLLKRSLISRSILKFSC